LLFREIPFSGVIDENEKIRLSGKVNDRVGRARRAIHLAVDLTGK
jgi:hypothetical protein